MQPKRHTIMDMQNRGPAGGNGQKSPQNKVSQ